MPLVFVGVIGAVRVGIAWSKAVRGDWAPVVGLLVSLASRRRGTFIGLQTLLF